MGQEARETEERRKTCAFCRFRENGTCVCMNVNSPKKSQFVYREDSCGQ